MKVDIICFEHQNIKFTSIVSSVIVYATKIKTLIMKTKIINKKKLY